jgi:cobalamin biosynthesis protein CobT
MLIKPKPALLVSQNQSAHKAILEGFDELKLPYFYQERQRRANYLDQSMAISNIDDHSAFFRPSSKPISQSNMSPSTKKKNARQQQKESEKSPQNLQMLATDQVQR